MILLNVKNRIVLKFLRIEEIFVFFFFLNNNGVMIIIKNNLGLKLIDCFYFVRFNIILRKIWISGVGIIGKMWLVMFDKVIVIVNIIINLVNFIVYFFYFLFCVSIFKNCFFFFKILVLIILICV